MSKYGPQNRQANPLPGAPDIPWFAAADWRQANLALQHLCTRHQTSLAPVRSTARKLKSHLEALYPLLDALCDQTCNGCAEPCCHVATVWFDFRDLVFMHLSGQAITAAQLSRSPDGACRSCGPTGCRLPRLSRPWTCAWYLCPPQKFLLAEMPTETLADFEKTIAAIKTLRKRMEAEFISVTT